MLKRTVQLTSCKKNYTYDQDKALTPQETVDRFLGRLKTCNLDILKEIRRIDNGRLDIPVYFSVCGQDAVDIIGTKKQMGKGSTPEQSRASACMELAERFSFFSFLNQADRFLLGDYQSMEQAGHRLLGLDTLLDSVHDSALSPELLHQLLQGLPLRWTWATHLNSGEPVLIPFSWFYAINEFNGPSAGNTYEEAVLQGVSEVVERHVCALISREQLPVPAIDPDSVTDPVARQLLDKFAQNGIELWLRDFSLDTGIPTVGVLAWDPTTLGTSSELVFTAGTTPDPDKALIRALTEVAQLAGDFNSGSNYVASGLPKPLTLDEVAYLQQPERTVAIQDLPRLGHADMLKEVEHCLAALARLDLEVFVVDTRHDALNIPAIYTIIPGAHFRERAAGGNAALFAAKLAAQLLQGPELEAKLDQMQTLLPGAYFLAFYRGQSLYERGETEQALYWFDQALAAQPSNEDLPYLYSFKGCCLRNLGLFAQAVEVLEQGLAADEQRPDLHNASGVCQFKLGNHAQAVVHFQRAVELHPTSAIDYANLGLNLELLGQRQEAMAQYRIALELDPTITFAHQHLHELNAQDR